MTLLVIETELKQHIGFILFAGKDSPFDSESWSGECVFTGVPVEPPISENALCKYLQNKKNEEFTATCTSKNNHFEIKINNLLEANINNQLVGTWLPATSALSKSEGICHVPQS